MKCNRCGQENMVGAKFCSSCGGVLDQDNMVSSTSMAPVMTNTPITSGGFNNLNGTAQARKNPAHVIMIVECVFGTLFVAVVVGLVIWSMLGKSSGSEMLRCTRDTKAVSSSVALTYNKDKMSKIEMTYIIDKTANADNLRGVDAEDYMMAGFANMAFSQYDGKDGVQYKYSDQSTITTIAFEADLTKMNKSDAAELTEDYDGLTMDEIKDEYTDDGYSCTVK